MDWLGPVFTAIVNKLDPISIILLFLVAGCGYFHIVWRREDRSEREKLMGVIEKNNEALNSLKNVLSAAIGKAL